MFFVQQAFWLKLMAPCH